jgi:hypothetical protein
MFGIETRPRAVDTGVLALLVLWAAACEGEGPATPGDAGTGGMAAPGGDGGSGGSGGGGSGGQGGDAGGPPDEPLVYRTCAAEERVGVFTVLGRAEDDVLDTAVTEITGYVRNGVVPREVWEEVATEGECKLKVGPTLFCDPRCSSDQICTSAGTCEPAPVKVDAGSVSIEGLAAPLTMSANSANNYIPPPGTQLAYPAYTPGADIRLSAQGGEAPAFELRGRGVAELELPEGEISVAEGEAVVLRWTPDPASGSGVRVHVDLDIAHHGGIFARIDCDAEDDGMLEIPASLVSQLLDRGVAGFPAVAMTRRSVDSTMTELGCVEFVVASRVKRSVSIPGLVSCSEEQPCPMGQICQTDLTCR